MKQQSLDKRLNLYLSEKGSRDVSANTLLLAASAVAGIGAALVPPPAEAAIVYSGVQNKVLSKADPTNKTVDFDGDGIVDCRFNFAFSSASSVYSQIFATVPDNAIIATTNGLPAKLDSNYMLSNNKNFPDSGGYLAVSVSGGDNASGKFINDSGYLGVKFKINDTFHFGWIQFEANANSSIGTIIDWAYEDVPGKAIKTGDKKNFNWNLFLPAIIAGGGNG